MLIEAGVVASLGLGLVNIYFNFRTAKRTTFINTVTSERVKWISKFREDLSNLCALCNQWLLHPDQQTRPEQLRKIEQAKNEIRLKLNPNDTDDKEIERLLARLPSWTQGISYEDYLILQNALVTAAQAMLKREWDKVKDEALRGDLRQSRKGCCNSSS